MFLIYLGTLFASVSFCSCQSSTIIFNVMEVQSSDDVILVCKVPPPTNLTRWAYLSGQTGTSLMRYHNEQCIVSPSDSFLSNRHLFSYTCNSSVHRLTIHPRANGIHNDILTCRDAMKLNGPESTWIIKLVDGGYNCSYCIPTITFNLHDMTEGENVTLICKVSSDVPYVNWNRNIGSNTAAMRGQYGQCTTSPPGTTFLDNTSKYIYTCNSTVYQVIRIHVSRSEHNDMYMCTPMNQTEGTGSNWIIKVKSPVTYVTITPANSLVNVKENTSVEFTCTTSTSRPAASVYWYINPNGNSNDITQITENITSTTDYNDLSVITSTLHFVPQRQHSNTKIYCTANNSVNANPVRSNQKILLNIRYKADDPYILQGNEYRVTEHTSVTLTCTVRGGNPTPTLSWRCNNFSLINKSTIHYNGNVTTTFTWNVSRTHEGTCTCTSQQTYFTNETIDVSVVVVYEVSHLSFSINGLTDKVATVNESTAVIFKCNTDGNPPPVMTLTNGTNVLVSRTSRLLEYNLSNVSCKDNGTYRCSARNELNVHTVVSSIDLIVLCSPRPIEDIDETILTGIGMTVEIFIEVIAYPTPSFTWWSHVNDQWKMIQTTDRQLINSSGLLSSLTINNVNEDDFTSYKVVAKNNVGNMEQIYKLHDGSPDVPTQLRYLEALSTSSSIQLAWNPGYNGGSTQIFYIKYKSKDGSSWNYKTVSDDLEQTRIYTLKNLKDDMFYYIIILASNKYGNSTESSLLIANTKEIETTHLAFMIGGIVGGVIFLAASFMTVFILIRKNQTNTGCLKQPRTCQQTESTNEITNEAPTDTQYDDIVRDNEYEMINQDSSPAKPYSVLQENDSITQAESNRENTYENTI